MSSSVTENTVSGSLASRLISIDVMRGLTVAFMILVNNNGQNDHAYRQLNHSPWNGFTATDLVFPTFLFIMGISLVLSIEARLSKGFSTASYITHTIWRFVILFLLGLVVNGFPFFHFGTLRIYGVLQRIALCYLVSSLLQLGERGVASKVGLLSFSPMGYWILMRWVPVPGYGVPGTTFPILDSHVNLVAYIDRQIFPGRLFDGTRDLEGLLSTLPAIGSTLIGMLAGMWLRSSRSAKEKLTGMNCSNSELLKCHIKRDDKSHRIIEVRPATLIGPKSLALVGGPAAVWVRARQEEGSVRLTAAHPQFGVQTIQIKLSAVPAERV